MVVFTATKRKPKTNRSLTSQWHADVAAVTTYVQTRWRSSKLQHHHRTQFVLFSTFNFSNSPSLHLAKETQEVVEILASLKLEQKAVCLTLTLTDHSWMESQAAE